MERRCMALIALEDEEQSEDKEEPSPTCSAVAFL
jgi:hypothetical protein